MAAVDKLLVDRDARIIKLLDPPFDTSKLEPGYIKGYVPGVRENGGQYTHAAIWAAMAFAMMGDAERAWQLFSMLNPVRHGDRSDLSELYKVEPYVVSADVYGARPHTGRGGWTWYTGAAAWMYRLVVETLIGIRLDVDKLRLTPLLPEHWESCKVHYRYRETFYHITIKRVAKAPETESLAKAPEAESLAKAPETESLAKAPETESLAKASGAEPVAKAPGAERVDKALELVIRGKLDGVALEQEETRVSVPLVDDRRDHYVEVELA
jgi:cellobiose phosphorylase